jgi:hypothetical protein
MLIWQNPLSGACSLVCQVLGENFQYIWRAPYIHQFLSQKMGGYYTLFANSKTWNLDYDT